MHASESMAKGGRSPLIASSQNPLISNERAHDERDELSLRVRDAVGFQQRRVDEDVNRS